MAAISLPVIVCLIMVLSSFFVAASHASSGLGVSAFDDISERSHSALPDAGPQGRVWDWAAMAADSGVVDVIVLLPETEPAAALMSMCADGGQGCESLQGLNPSITFSASMNGFAASLSPEAISSLQSMVPGAVVYPDLPVNATLAKSVGKIGADQVWGRNDPTGVPVTGVGIVVAVIDTGIDYTHPDLGGGLGPAYKVIGGYDFVNRDSDPMDDNGHGTHVAGIIAADGGVTGVAPSAKLLAYKVLGSDGSGSMSTVISAIDKALDPNGDGLYDDRADIISMSLGGAGDPDDPVCLAVQRAISQGVVVVVAAGNGGPSLGTVASPGMAFGAVTVGAVDEYGVVAPFSSRGPVGDLVMKPEMTAPGVQILSTVPYANVRYSSPTGYMAMSGTSMATPHVSGAAALIIQMHPDWTPEMVKSALVSGSMEMGDSYWVGGAGEMWIPRSMDSTLFSTTPFVSYGLAGDVSVTVPVTCPGTSVTLSSDSDDWYSLGADGVQATPVVTTLSSVSPSYLSIMSGGTGQFTLTISGAVSSVPEGYYDGEILLTSGSMTHRIPFGFVVLCKLNVHVYDDSGREVFDPYGAVLVYRLPDADIALSKRGYMEPSPPADFLVPSGTYAIHALGHQLMYVFSDPYVLSATVDLGRMQTLEVSLRMSDAKELVVDLETEGGQPIFVKDLRMYARYEGTRNVSLDLTGSDYSIIGSQLFSVPRSLTVHVTDTDAQIGIAVSGFSYTPDMWRFMELNWDHWFEYVSGLSTSFMFEASADLQYLLAWEFDGVGASTPSALSWDDGTARYYETKYDIPGTILNPWCNWGDHRSMGGDAAFFVRRDTDTSLNSFFSGMTRTTIVRGTFSELYYPRGLFEGFFERQYYSPDYDHLVHAGTVSEIYLPDRSFLDQLPAGTVVESIGSGPFYPSLYTENTGSTLVLFHPLLRDESGTRVGGKSGPSMNLYKNGGLMGMYQLSEFLARPDAVRYVSLFGDGAYTASVKYYPSSQIYDDVLIELGFSVPRTDMDPPRITGMQMPQRFVPGHSLPLSFTAVDSSSSVMASVSWRPSGTTEWSSLSVQQQSGVFSTSIPTSQSNTGVDIKIEVVDTSGNFLRYTAKHASLAQVPVVFELSLEDDRVRYSIAPDQVVLTGRLTSASGSPLSTTAAVPLELFVGDRKVGMVLDEYMTSSSHTHDGRIRFDWTVDPTTLFTGPNQTVEVRVSFDLGVYAPVDVSFELRSVFSGTIPPQVTLVSPANGALIAAGELIVIAVDDDDQVTFQYSVDGGTLQTTGVPYEISTSSWSDGVHSLSVVVTDLDLNRVTATYSFDVDATLPTVSLPTPVDGREVPKWFTLEVDVQDAHLSGVTASVDGASPVPLPHPYAIDMASWALGQHTLVVTATDAVGHMTSLSVSFEIVDSTLVLSLLSPGDGAYLRSGTPLYIYVLSSGTLQCTWSGGAAAQALSHPYEIDTHGWSEDAHAVTVSASDDLGSSAEISFTVTIDDTFPVIEFVSPEPGSFVTSEDSITIGAYDANFDRLVWSLSGFVGESVFPDVSISLAYFMIEGDFTLQISVLDKAGNEAEDSLAYVMDVGAPSISVGGVAAGGAIAPDGSIDVVVTDPLLSFVSYSVDSNAMAEASSSFSIDMSPLALGWHQLSVHASDSGGHQSSLSVSFYVDGKRPDVEMTSEDSYVEGRDFVVSAVVSDDFALAKVLCRYESSDGGFLEVPMALGGEEYKGSIPSSDLWDGMSVYVVAEDTVGNSAETSSVALAASGPGTGSDGLGALLGSLAFLATVVAVASVVLVSLALLSSRNRRKKASYVSSAEHPGARPHRVIGPIGPVTYTADTGVPDRRPTPITADGYSVAHLSGQSLVDGRVSVLDALAILPVEAQPAPEQEQVPDEQEYLEQLERVLNLALISKPTSVDGGGYMHLNSLPEQNPQKISGLTLKRLMDRDR